MPEPTADEIVEAAALAIDECIARAEAANPQLRGLSAQINQDRAAQRLAGLQQYPDLTFGLQWWLVNDNVDVLSPIANGADTVGFTVGVTLPIHHERNASAVCEAAAKRQSTTQLREATRAELLGQVRRLIAQSDALRMQLDLYTQRIIPRTEAAIRIATNDYTANRNDFASLIDIYRELLAYQMQVARTRASLYGVHAQLRRAMGGG
jgi:outer membrane protein TolC